MSLCGVEAILLAEKLQEGGHINGWQTRYWLLERGRRDPEADESWAEDFVCCEVPVGEEYALALEVFTSRTGAEAEARGMESLARTRHLRVAEGYGGRVDAAAGYAASGGVVELSGPELFEVLDGSGVPYVLVDPPPVDTPIKGGLHIELTSAFAEELRRRLIGAITEGRL